MNDEKIPTCSNSALETIANANIYLGLRNIGSNLKAEIDFSCCYLVTVNQSTYFI